MCVGRCHQRYVSALASVFQNFDKPWFLAHRNLFGEKQILHRDISVNNILIGKKEAKPGWRGVLIDLDMAIFISRDQITPRADFRTVSPGDPLLYLFSNQI